MLLMFLPTAMSGVALSQSLRDLMPIREMLLELAGKSFVLTP
jgi:hypothetical protein